ANAIYAGSFDPFTNGHLNIADKASQIFDKVYVVVASNPNKPAKFLTIDEREKSINNALKAQKLTNVEALSHDGLLVD
ncbi:adenylyltransferase/cytidyltransferase family protein, partial [Streptomyces galilaeus]|uniref:adenylyltransferase/cytidyltransferase family protein n=1 Tax=Streptomyces galilaeus TaxID=33899 RepID=UPI0038F66FDD